MDIDACSGTTATVDGEVCGGLSSTVDGGVPSSTCTVDQVCGGLCSTADGEVCGGPSFTVDGEVFEGLHVSSIDGEVCGGLSSTADGEVCEGLSSTADEKVCNGLSSTADEEVCNGLSSTVDGEVCKGLYFTVDGDDGNCSSSVIGGEVFRGASLVGEEDTAVVDGRVCELCAPVDVGSCTDSVACDSCQYKQRNCKMQIVISSTHSSLVSETTELSSATASYDFLSSTKLVRKYP